MSTTRVVAFLSTLLLVAACAGGSAVDPEDLIGSDAPALTGDDLTGTGVTNLSDLMGKPTVVVFWLNSCPHCQSSVPAIQAAWGGHSEMANILTAGITNVNVEGGAGFETAADFVTTTGLTLPTIEATWEGVSGPWMLPGTPTVFVLDSQHVIRAALVGENDLVERLESSLQDLAGG